MLKFREIYEIWRKDNSLTQALNDSYAMLERTHAMFQASVKCLRDGAGAEVSFDIYAEDRLINQYQIGVRRKVLRYLAVTGTVNLAPGLVLTSIVIDIERIGDYTKNIMELAVAYPGKLTCGRHESRVCKLEEAIELMFNPIGSVLQSYDKKAARALIDECRWIRRGADEILVDLIQGEDPSVSRGDAAAVALYVRYIKRIGAHLLNILSSVVNPFERIGYREADQ